MSPYAVEYQFLDAYSQCIDIQARALFTKAAIETAYQQSETDSCETTLKVFMAPEFLYRGAGGAYIHDLVRGWEHAPPEFGLQATPYGGKWGGLFDILQDIVTEDKYKHWVFVFGTAVSASFKTKLIETPIIDQQGNRSSLNQSIIDFNQPVNAVNTALIQLGGRANRMVNHVNIKNLKSNIDFLHVASLLPPHNRILLNGQVAHFDNPNIIDENCPGGALFVLTGVNVENEPLQFGIEICLDHAITPTPAHPFEVTEYGRLKAYYTRERTRSGSLESSKVKIQLVPSAGMSLQPNSICLKPTGNSYVFNVDGLNGLRELGEGAGHTQINNNRGTHQFGTNFWVNANSSTFVAVPNEVTIAQINIYNHFFNILCSDYSLWNRGAGGVRIMGCLPL
jgi:hypothetical protein